MCVFLFIEQHGAKSGMYVGMKFGNIWNTVLKILLFRVFVLQILFILQRVTQELVNASNSGIIKRRLTYDKVTIVMIERHRVVETGLRCYPAVYFSSLSLFSLSSRISTNISQSDSHYCLTCLSDVSTTYRCPLSVYRSANTCSSITALSSFHLLEWSTLKNLPSACGIEWREEATPSEPSSGHAK